MALAPIRREVVHALALIHEARREAQAQFVDGTDDVKVVAAGELELLRRLEVQLTRRLGEIDQRMSSAGPFAWVRQAWFDLMLHMESWIAHG